MCVRSEQRFPYAPYGHSIENGGRDPPTQERTYRSTHGMQATTPGRMKRLQMLHPTHVLMHARLLRQSAPRQQQRAWALLRKRRRGYDEVSRSIRKKCNGAILIAFAAAMLAVCISPVLASATYIPPDPPQTLQTPRDATG